MRLLLDRVTVKLSRTIHAFLCIFVLISYVSVSLQGCNSLSQRNIAHVDYDPYMFILKCVRADETRRESVSGLAFIMQQHDVYHLVNHIWHGRSAVSKNKDLFLLRLARYEKDIEWSPWNCILLTKDEVDVHYRLEDFTKVYSVCLINQIHLAHQIAKNYFKWATSLCI